MNAISEKLPALVAEELETANMMHTVFHSPHEGYAVIMEETDEVCDELERIGTEMSHLWEAVKLDNEADGRNYARMIERTAIRLAAEAIQVAAMARKFQAMGPEEWGGRNEL